MAALTIQNVAQAGITPSYAAASGGGDTIADNGNQRVMLHVKNGGGGSINVTIAKNTNISSVTVPGVGPLTVADRVVAVANGTERMIGPFPRAYVQDNGLVNITYSGVTSVTVGAFALPKVDEKGAV